MIVSHRHRFVFFAVPRTATHAVRAALADTLGPKDWRQEALTERVALPVPPPETPRWMTDRVCALACTSLRNVLMAPSSATASTPGLAVPPDCQNVTPLPCTAPISVVK